MFDGKKLFDKLSNTAKNAVNSAQRVAGNFTQKQADRHAQSNTSHTVYEVFTPGLGIGKKFIITDNSLIFGSEEFSYSQLSPICVAIPPAPLVTNAVASTVVNGRTLNLAFDYSQRDRFAKAIVYANEQIELAHGRTINYKYIIQSPQGSKIEVYDDYLMLYELKSGVTKVFSNAMQDGAAGVPMYLDTINVALNGNGEKIFLVISRPEGTYSIELNSEQIGLANQVIEYITSAQNAQSTQNTGVDATKVELEQEICVDEWENVTGQEQRFTLNGKTLVIPKEMDIFNTYRLKYFELASLCADKAKAEYMKQVRDLNTYLTFFPVIYYKNLDILIKQSMGVIISEGIWSITEESLSKEHLEEFDSGFDTYWTIMESIELTIEQNQSKIASVMSFIPNLTGGGFGLKGAAKGIATATAFNLIRDGAEDHLLQNASNLNQAQRLELYQRVNVDDVFEFVFQDYWRVMLTMMATLIDNGIDIWWPDEDLIEQSENIFSNLSNPRFPQEKLLDVFINILEIHPYNADYHKFMVRKFGDTEETRAIRNYFGYTDLENSRMG